MIRIICLGLLSCAWGLAQETPTAEQFLAAYVSRLGGVEKLRSLNTVTLKGTLDNPDDVSKVLVEIHAKAPNLYARVAEPMKPGGSIPRPACFCAVNMSE